MSFLASELRSQLAVLMRDARRVAEVGARQALQATLAVDQPAPHGSMSEVERRLRRRLRAHGRQLGDRRNGKTGAQEIRRLVHEVAYEHWHRMLFARFLAENELLIEPDSGVAVSLAECEELARERGEDSWALAGRFAQRMLPRIFRPDDPALEVALAPETRQELKRLLESLPAEVFIADDSLGWTYQFWQTEHKDAVNASEVKIGADELPAVTQLFTERYMVLFLFHNTVGAWWAAKILAERPELAENPEDEEALRRAVRLKVQGGYDFSYLRFVRETQGGDEEGKPTGPWQPAAGAFDGWPSRAVGLRVLDPCCGSGHFLVEGLALMVRLRMEEEKLGVEEAVRAVLKDNLFGLEIDPRCTQIAAFNVALAAWKLIGKPVELPPLNIACSGQAPNATKDEWVAGAEYVSEVGGMPLKRDLPSIDDMRLRNALTALHELFRQAPELGSLIDPNALKADLLEAGFVEVQPFLAAVLEQERKDEEQVERAVAAQGMARAAELLADRYTLVITNVPYLHRGKQSQILRDFADTQHREAKNDLATIFVARAFDWLGEHGAQAVVTPQNWLSLTSYRKLREKLLCDRTWRVVARLGPGAFETIGGEVVNVALSVLSAGKPKQNWRMAGIDVSVQRSQQPIRAAEKSMLLQVAQIDVFEQTEQAKNPDSRIAFTGSVGDLLEKCAKAYQGIATGDYACYGRKFWEFPEVGYPWEFQQSTVLNTVEFGGREHVVHWGEEGEIYAQRREGVRIQGGGAWNRPGIVVSQMGALPVTRYTGELFDNNASAIGLSDDDHLPAMWCFCSSPQYAESVREIDQNLKVTNATLVKVPFDLPHWQKVAAEKYPNGLPEPYSNDPTQWIFHGHPCCSVVWDENAKRTRHGPLRTDGAVLQIAVARLLGYRWPPERNSDICLADEARALVERCGDLCKFADADGIVCPAALQSESSAADRLRRLLTVSYGDSWSPAIERTLLAAVAGNGKPAVSLEDWLRDRFFTEHCKLFHHRPFIWHVWDGRKDGFHALVNYHRLAGSDGEGRRTLEALAYSYLGDWIERQKAAQRKGEEGADGRLAAAQDLQAQLEKILAGEPPCDLFVRWRPLHDQPIGWEPDIDDGVRFNIRPFMSVQLSQGGRTGAGILRAKPNIKWSKDRGKEPASPRPREDFPWFWACPGDGALTDRTDFPGGAEFDGNRWNDLHYTVAAKRKARERKSEATAP